MDYEESDSDESWTTESAISSEAILSSMCMNGGEEKPFACPVPGCKKRYKVKAGPLPGINCIHCAERGRPALGSGSSLLTPSSPGPSTCLVFAETWAWGQAGPWFLGLGGASPFADPGGSSRSKEGFGGKIVSLMFFRLTSYQISKCAVHIFAKLPQCRLCRRLTEDDLEIFKGVDVGFSAFSRGSSCYLPHSPTTGMTRRKGGFGIFLTKPPTSAPCP